MDEGVLLGEGALLLDHVPGAAPRYKVSRDGRHLGWVERRDGWWYADGPDRRRLPERHRRRREALAQLTELSPP